MAKAFLTTLKNAKKSREKHENEEKKKIKAERLEAENRKEKIFG